jgi:glycosyltransferase involved in cell wall biosynthesis
MKLAAIVLTKNEERNIVACLESLRWADGLIVLDSLSTDRTTQLAKEAGARVLTRPFDHYAAQRNAAFEAADAEWVLFVDADERVTPALADEVREKVSTDAPLIAGYWLPRENHIVGRVIRGGGWYPDYQLRLLRRGRARYDPARPVHEVVLLDGEAGYLRHPLIHYNYETWAQFHAKQRRYAELEALALYQQGVRPRPHHYVLQPWREFRRRYWTLAGYGDGLHGLRLSLYMAWYTLIARLYLRSLWAQKR